MASEGSNSNISNTSRRNVAENQKRKAVLMAAALAGGIVATTPGLVKEPMYDSVYTGEIRMQELIRGHDKRFYNSFGMTKDVYYQLKLDLQELVNFVPTQHMSMDEQLGIFLCVCRSGFGTRDIQELFQRSPDTVHK